MTRPDAWDALRARLDALFASRDATLEDTARAWAGFARAQGWSRADVERLWEGLTEDVVRCYARAPGDRLAETQREVLAVMAAVRERILTCLPSSQEPGP
jgi:hypothetical protein